MQTEFIKLFQTVALSYFERLLYIYAAEYCRGGNTIPAAPAYVRALFFPYDSTSLKRVSLAIENLIYYGFFKIENGILSPAMPDEDFLFFPARGSREEKSKATKETERKEAKERTKKITEKKRERETSLPLSPQKSEKNEEIVEENIRGENCLDALEKLGVKNVTRVAGIDYKLLAEKIGKSKYLSSGKPFAWIVAHYGEIIADKYEDFPPMAKVCPGSPRSAPIHFENERSYTREELEALITEVENLVF